MSEPFRPYEKLIEITVFGKKFQVPDRNSLLRCFQFLSPETIPYGRFCWTQDCQYCRVGFDMGEGTQTRAALSCKLTAQYGLRVTELSTEIRYCLRTLNLPRKEEDR